MDHEFAILLLWALAGTFLAALLALLPALHIYNIAGLFILFADRLAPWLAPEAMAFLFLGMIAGYAMLNTLPSIFLSVPDESTLFIVLPGQKYLMQRRAYEAVVLSGIGGVGGLLALVLMVPVAPRLFPRLYAVLRPHIGWLLWTVIAYMLISEWPKGSDRAPAGWPRFREGWQSLLAGLATFLLSGFLGFLLLYRPLVPVERAYQNLLPAFVGLFAVPWLLQNLRAAIELPPQHLPTSIERAIRPIVHGTLSGIVGGLFAAFFPVVTGGLGGLLAGQATGQRDERAFIVSQGASKVVYYVGGFLLFFVPGLHLTRGGMAWMISTRYSALTPDRYPWATAAALLSGTLAFFLSLGLARLLIRTLRHIDYRHLSLGTLLLVLGLVAAMTGWRGLAICAVATGIGFIPVLWGTRRMNAMGLLLLPIALNMIGAGATIARWLGLL